MLSCKQTKVSYFWSIFWLNINIWILDEVVDNNSCKSDSIITEDVKEDVADLDNASVKVVEETIADYEISDTHETEHDPVADNTDNSTESTVDIADLEEVQFPANHYFNYINVNSDNVFSTEDYFISKPKTICDNDIKEPMSDLRHFLMHLPEPVSSKDCDVILGPENTLRLETGKKEKSLNNNSLKEKPAAMKQNKSDKNFLTTLKRHFSNLSKKSKDSKNKKEMKQNSTETKSQVTSNLTDGPRMTSTPLTRCASFSHPGDTSYGPRDIEYRYNCASNKCIPDEVGGYNYGGDLPLPPLYRTTALRKQHQRWSFAGASLTVPSTQADEVRPW